MRAKEAGGSLGRSWLFSPADVPERCLKALAAGADQVIWDLEDGVAEEKKALARANLSELMAKAGEEPPWIRINGVGSTWAEEDMALLWTLDHTPLKIVVPKADAHSVSRLAQWVSERPRAVQWLWIIESAQGLWDVMHAEGPWMSEYGGRLAFGALDYQTDLAGEVGPGEEEILMARSQIALASRVWGWPSPIDAVFPGISDTQGLDASARRARRLGFGGKMVIHPRQIPVVNKAFTPDDQEIQWARKVLAEIGRAGVLNIGGQMIDRPLIERARQILAAIGED